ncbi:MAG: RNA methyltransferase [Lachnospiraceae bacterium]|nr:RNA methyltransferase [Lachnospiraceae bacterium]
MISSTSNSQIKNLTQLQTKASARKKQKLFVVEGIKIFMEIPADRIRQVYISEDVSADKVLIGKIKEKLKTTGKKYEEICVEVASNIFKSVSDTVTPQGVIAVVEMRDERISSVLNENGDKTVLILDSLRDPGNMGTIIRTAEGAGVSAVLMNKECVDIYNPKVTRSTMGSIFRVPIVISENLKEDIDMLKGNGFKIFAGHLNGTDYDRHPDFCGNVGIVIGNEANGISDEIAETADNLIRIPMSGKVESLNAAVAAAILMYEARSRR